VTVDRVPVAELHDHRNDGFIDELFLTGPPGRVRYGDWDRARYKERGMDRRYGRDRKPW